MKHYFKTSQKIIALALAIFIAFSSFIQVNQAHAQEVVEDISADTSGWLNEVENALSTAYNAVSSFMEDSIWIKDYILDPLAWAVAKGMLQDITNSTVSWINSGFKGSPSFVQNPEQFFQQIGDNARWVISLPDQTVLWRPCALLFSQCPPGSRP